MYSELYCCKLSYLDCDPLIIWKKGRINDTVKCYWIVVETKDKNLRDLIDRTILISLI